MKKLLLFLLTCGTLCAAPRTLEWDAPEEGVPVKYHLYEKLSPGWTKVAESVTLETTIPVAPGPHTYAVTAVSLLGDESPMSNELTFVEPLPPPQNLRIKISASADLQTWNDVATVDVPQSPGGRVFYQLAFSP